MNKHSKLFSLENLLSKLKITKKSPFNNHQIKETTIFINSEVLNSEDTEIIEKYFDSIIRNIPVIKNNKTIVVFPDLFNCLNFSIGIKDKIFETKNKILKLIRKLAKNLQENKIKVFHEINLSYLLSYSKIINQYSNLEASNNHYVASENNDKNNKLDMSKFLKTKNVKISDSKNGQNVFKENVKKITTFYLEFLFAAGFIFKELVYFIDGTKDKKTKENLKEVEYYLKDIRKNDLCIGILLDDNLKKNIYADIKNSNIFEHYWVKIDQNKNSNTQLKMIDKISKYGYHSVLNYSINNLNFESFNSSPFNFIDVYTCMSEYISLANLSIVLTWPLFVNDYSKNDILKLTSLYGYSFKPEQVVIPTEKIFIQHYNKWHKQFSELKLKISQESWYKRKISDLFSFNSLRKFNLTVEEEKFELVFNLSKYNKKINYSKNNIIYSNQDLIPNQISSMQYFIKK
ncbi:hypothetical protein [Mycoplasmopsis alligatoris]|uniref:Uncharacterized protein n=1 Tax=Mycoplasmopsis alligatoris A21JP2 TaxID=747682 RepID=D4XVX2_9BACT|nr:hypothetical protein [Mycoplasmopsis alligatoris]EFF41498.1 hypothetical protein MALL_0833 [Mycoplasmopsis alligatoris A21JP2]